MLSAPVRERTKATMLSHATEQDALTEGVSIAAGDAQGANVLELLRRNEGHQAVSREIVLLKVNHPVLKGLKEFKSRVRTLGRVGVSVTNLAKSGSGGRTEDGRGTNALHIINLRQIVRAGRADH